MASSDFKRALEHGFTLIELLITLFIVGIILAMSAWGLMGSRAAQLERNACDGLAVFIASGVAHTGLHPEQTAQVTENGGMVRLQLSSGQDLEEPQLELPPSMTLTSTLLTDGNAAQGEIQLSGKALKCRALSSRSGDVEVKYE